MLSAGDGLDDALRKHRRQELCVVGMHDAILFALENTHRAAKRPRCEKIDQFNAQIRLAEKIESSLQIYGVGRVIY